MTFFKQAFMLVVYVYCVPFVAIERQLKASSKHNLVNTKFVVYTKFCMLFFEFVYVICKKDQLNMNITFKVIIISTLL